MPQARPKPIGHGSQFISLRRRRAPMGFVRFIAAQQVELGVTFGDGMLEGTDRGKLPRFVYKSVRIDAPLIRPRRPVLSEVVLRRDRTAVELQRRKPETTLSQ